MQRQLPQATKRPRRDFSIDELLADDNNRPSPPKRQRRFPMEQMFAEDPWLRDSLNEHFGFRQQQQQQRGAGTTPPAQPKQPKDYVRQLAADDIERMPEFNVTKVKSRFSIVHLPSDPEALLAGIFQHCMDVALEECRTQKYEPTHLGCTISSELLTKDIWAPVRPLNDNILDTLLNRLDRVVQSKKAEEVNLWGAPFTVCITTVNRRSLPPGRTLRGGARRSALAPVHHRINPKSLIKINNRGPQNNHCLFYALQATLVHHTSNWPSWKFYDYMHGRYGQRGQLEMNARALMRQVGAPAGHDAYDAEVWIPRVVDYWNNVLFSGRHQRIKVFVFGSSGAYRPRYKYPPTSHYNVAVLLYLDNGHFDGVVREGGLFGRRYCLECEKPFNKASAHTKSCRARCLLCSRVGPRFPCQQIAGFLTHCHGCQKSFTNPDCHRHHLQSRFCARSKQCEKCGSIWDVYQNTRNGRKGHVCGERFCQKCNGYRPPKHNCYIQPLEPNNEDNEVKRPPYRIISFDLETMQHEPVDPTTPQRRTHQPNFIAAKIACPECIENGEWRNSMRQSDHKCQVCGPDRTVAFCQRPFTGTEVDHQVSTERPLEAFVDWLLFKLPKQYKSVAFSHWGGRFDMVLVFKELFRRGMNPEMLRNGNRMYEMKVERERCGTNSSVTFRDSYNLVSCKLADLVPTYGLDVPDKPHFPHMSNRPENYGRYIYPTPQDYLVDGKKPSEKKAFDEWYALHKHEPFFLDEKLAEYCVNDVEILMSGLVAFRTEFMEVSKRNGEDSAIGDVPRAASTKPHDGIDVLREAMTISAACMRHYRTNHLKKDHLALIPERGYDNAQNQSELALRYLHWYAEEHGVQVQTAHSLGGEKKFGAYSVDGWVESHGRVIEFNGCAWHGCRRCYPGDNLMLPNGKTAGYQRTKDARRMSFIRQQQDVKEVEIVWECDIRQRLERDNGMRKRFADYKDEGPLNIRAAFMGGRTGPRKLFHRTRPGWKMSYFDVTSMYPFVNTTTTYPVGHPTVHVLNEDVCWTRAADNPYPMSLLKVMVVPPRHIDVPVLPLRVDERLIFGTCVACAKQFPEGGMMPDYSCAHTDEERGWISTITSIELNAALDEGYTVTKLYRVLEYTETDDALLSPYIAEFMAQKIHASGFDKQIKGDPEAEQQFVRECWERFGIEVDPQKMAPNKGKRALAKLALNNLWGKFSMRNLGLSRTHITDDPAEFADFLDNPTIEISGIDKLNDRSILSSYLTKKDWVEEHSCSNIVVSLWTTSAARLHLLKLMQKVVRSGAELLYTDTDSLIYSHPENDNPLSLGPHLGDLTDEYPDHEILEFCCGGAKQYGLKIRHRESGKLDYVLKLRGITLSYDVMHNQRLRYETFRERVLKFARTGQVDVVQLVYPNFIRPSIVRGEVTSGPFQKVYKPFVGKGIIGTNYRILDFGHIQTPLP